MTQQQADTLLTILEEGGHNMDKHVDLYPVSIWHEMITDMWGGYYELVRGVN